MNILIIGATSGIGHNLWVHYVTSGHNVIVVGRRRELLDDMERSCPEHTLPVLCDISQTESFYNAWESIIHKHSRIDLAIVCAGIGELNPNLDVETELSTLSVNVWVGLMQLPRYTGSLNGRNQVILLPLPLWEDCSQLL